VLEVIKSAFVATSTGREEITMQAINIPNGDTLVVLPLEEVVLPLEEYERLIDKVDIAAGRDEMATADIVNHILDDENSIRIWRNHRGMSARDLAEAASTI
jgi:hypothetical protein